MPSSSSKSKPKASDVASEARRYYTPLIKEQYSSIWTTESQIFDQPLQQIDFVERPLDTTPPYFCEQNIPLLQQPRFQGF